MVSNSGFLKKTLSLTLIFAFMFTQLGLAQVATELNLAAHLGRIQSGIMYEKFRAPHLRYFSYDNATNNLSVLLDKGDIKDGEAAFIEESAQDLLKYFLIGIVLPDENFWVNLRPDSEDNIISGLLAKTDIGKILLEADVQLKKDTALLTSPQTPQGKIYWDRLYKKAYELYGSDNVSIPTLTRPWIVPGEIVIRESKDSAYIYKANLKVMLEEDHLKGSATYSFKDPLQKALNEYSSQLIRELIIPQLTKEVNNSRAYAKLRQVYYSLILARWFKSRFYGKGGLYASYINKGNLEGLTSSVSWSKDTYFKAYQDSFRNGEYNIKTPVNSLGGASIRSYFSGGIDVGKNPNFMVRDGSSPVDAFTANSPVRFFKAALDNGSVYLSAPAGINSQLKMSSPVAAVEEFNRRTDSQITSSPLEAVKIKKVMELYGKTFGNDSKIRDEAIESYLKGKLTLSQAARVVDLDSGDVIGFNDAKLMVLTVRLALEFDFLTEVDFANLRLALEKVYKANYSETALDEATGILSRKENIKMRGVSELINLAFFLHDNALPLSPNEDQKLQMMFKAKDGLGSSPVVQNNSLKRGRAGLTDMLLSAVPGSTINIEDLKRQLGVNNEQIKVAIELVNSLNDAQETGMSIYSDKDLIHIPRERGSDSSSPIDNLIKNLAEGIKNPTNDAEQLRQIRALRHIPTKKARKKLDELVRDFEKIVAPGSQSSDEVKKEVGEVLGVINGGKIQSSPMTLAQITKVLSEMRKYSGLPISTIAPSVVPADWSGALHEIGFYQPAYRRVEREAKTEERFTGKTAFGDAATDTDIRELITYKVGDGEFKSVRLGGQVRGFITDQNAELPTIAYLMHRGIFASREDIQKAFYDNKIRFDITVIPPGIWGIDYAKTVGHYHNPIEMPEIYQVVSGNVLWEMQKLDKDGNVEDVVTVRAKAGDIAIMLPGYGHVSVNLSETEPLVLANWLTWHQSSEYGSFEKQGGAAYYVVKNAEGKPELRPNQKYMSAQKSLPKPRQMVPKDGIEVFGLHRGEPIYNLVRLSAEDFANKVEFLNNPANYANELTVEATLDETKPQEQIATSSPVENITRATLMKNFQDLRNSNKKYSSEVLDMMKIIERQYLSGLISPQQFADVAIKAIDKIHPYASRFGKRRHIMTLANGTLPERFANRVREIIETSSFPRDPPRYLIEEENEDGSSSFQIFSGSPVEVKDTQGTGGIDFRTLPMTCKPMGGFCGLSFNLPKPAEVVGINVEKELQEINLMVERGIAPSGERVKELVAACYHRQELAGHAGELMSCLMRICKLEEDMVVPSDKELREAIVIVDLF